MTIQAIIKKHIPESLEPMMELAFSGVLSSSPVFGQVMAAASASEEVETATKEALGMPATIMVLLSFFNGHADAAKAMATELIESQLLNDQESTFLSFFVKTAGATHGN